MLYMNMVDYPLFLPVLSTLTWDTLLTLGTRYRYLELLSKPLNTTQTFKFVFDNVLLEHGGLPFIPPYAVQLDLQHLPDTQGYLGLLSEQCRPTHTF